MLVGNSLNQCPSGLFSGYVDFSREKQIKANSVHIFKALFENNSRKLTPKRQSPIIVRHWPIKVRSKLFLKK